MTEQSVNTRKRLIDAAIEVFGKKGFWKAKVDEIVKRAGLAKGTFYLYFESKSHCFKETLIYLHSETLKILKKKDTLMETIEAFLNRIHNHRDISEVFLFEALSCGDEFKNLYFEFKANLKDIFSEKLSKFKDKEIKLTLISGLIREIIEEEIIRKGEDVSYIMEKVKKAVRLIE